MTKETSPIPFEEFSSNLSRLFEQVIRDSKSLVVVNDKGERAVLKPVASSKRKGHIKTKADHEAFLAAAGSWKDEDVETFLRNNDESRKLNTRPPVDL